MSILVGDGIVAGGGGGGGGGGSTEDPRVGPLTDRVTAVEQDLSTVEQNQTADEQRITALENAGSGGGAASPATSFLCVAMNRPGTYYSPLATALFNGGNSQDLGNGVTKVAGFLDFGKALYDDTAGAISYVRDAGSPGGMKVRDAGFYEIELSVNVRPNYQGQSLGWFGFSWQSITPTPPGQASMFVDGRQYQSVDGDLILSQAIAAADPGIHVFDDYYSFDGAKFGFGSAYKSSFITAAKKVRYVVYLPAGFEFTLTAQLEYYGSVPYFFDDQTASDQYYGDGNPRSLFSQSWLMRARRIS